MTEQYEKDKAVHVLDNSSDDRKVLECLRGSLKEGGALDVATGFFEIGGFLDLGSAWEGLGRVRVLMGADTTRRSRQILAQALRKDIEAGLDKSLSGERRGNPFLDGVEPLVDALREGRVECRIYTKGGRKFHAKAYIVSDTVDGEVESAIIGSSNFTRPGLGENVELNASFSDNASAREVSEWFDSYWEDAEPVTPEVLQIVEATVAKYSPFQVYMKSMDCLLRDRELTDKEWETAGEEKGGSRIYPLLDECQKEGYAELMKIADKNGGAFLCDGTGMGKTFVGLMLIEKFAVHKRKRVALFAPKSARESVWKVELEKRLPHLSGGYSNVRHFSHTDFLRKEGGEVRNDLELIREQADVVIIDEAHYFRNKGRLENEDKEDSWYRKLYRLIENPDGTAKQVFLLTATPINNGLRDFQNQADLFAREVDTHFHNIGIPNLRAHLKEMEDALETQLTHPAGSADAEEARKVLQEDVLFESLVIQRSRKYAQKVQKSAGGRALLFPKREKPRVAGYSMEKTCAGLLGKLTEAFDRNDPQLKLSVYYPLAHPRDLAKAKEDPNFKVDEHRQQQLVGLQRTQFLKRLESSVRSFESSCARLLFKMRLFCEKNCATVEEKAHLAKWNSDNGDILGYVNGRQLELWDEDWSPAQPGAEEDVITAELLEEVRKIDRETYKIEVILEETFHDMGLLVEFLKMSGEVQDADDHKFEVLLKMLQEDPDLVNEKVLIFTEYADTARYLEKRLQEAGLEGVESVTSRGNKDRAKVVRRFSPYYNDTDSIELQADGDKEIKILVSTDMLADGLNLHDATRLINYDIHWNPVQVIQRIGRVDRRLNAEIEARMLEHNPERKRGQVVYWNFLPPDELDDILGLYNRVNNKTLRISATLGIQTGHLFSPDDEFNETKELHRFEESIDGTLTAEQEIRTEMRELLTSSPELLDEVRAIPDGVLSGKLSGEEGSIGVFLCYRLPGPDPEASSDPESNGWSDEAGESRWYLALLGSDEVVEDLGKIHALVQCPPAEARKMKLTREDLLACKERVEKHINKTYMAKRVAPQGARPTLQAWMELNEG